MRKGWLVLIILLLTHSVLQAQNTIPLEIGSSTIIPINDAQTISATFEGTAEDTLYMTLTSNTEVGVDAQINILAPNGAVIAQNNHIGDREWVLPFTLPETGRYTVSIQRQGFSDFTGDTTLILNTISVGEAALGDTLQGNLDATYSLAAYRINLEPETLFGYRLTCDGECTFVMLPDVPESTPVLAGYYASRLFQPLLKLVEGGAYTIYIQNQTADATYTLEMQNLEITPLEVNTPISGTIRNDTALIFSFNSAAGKVWQLNGTFGIRGDNGLEIYKFENRGAWEAIVARDYGTGPEGNSRISQFAAPEDGTYYIALYWASYQNDPSTEYTINLSPDSLQQLVLGTEFTGAITPESGQEIYLYTGKADERIRVTIERTSETGSISLRLLSEADEVFVYYERGSTRAQVDVTLPLDGRYQFLLSDIAYEVSTLGYRILIETIEE